MQTLYCHGYVVTPIIEACQKHGLFQLLDNNRFRKRNDLVRELKANESYLTLALQALESLGWVEKNYDDSYRLNKMANVSIFDKNLSILYSIDPRELLSEKSNFEILTEKIKYFITNNSNDRDLLLMQGSILLPLAVALNSFSPEDFNKFLKKIDGQQFLTIKEFLITHKWMSTSVEEVTSTVKKIIDSEEIYIVDTYRYLLSDMEKIMFSELKVSDAKNLYHQFYMQKDLNRECVFNGLKQRIISIFNQHPIEKQPRTIVNVGCGNGTLLKEIFQIIRESTERGKNLENTPIAIIGIDDNKESVDRTSRTLSDAGILHKVFITDINNPGKISELVLGNENIDENQILYINVFLGRKLCVDDKQEASASLSHLKESQLKYSIGPDAKLLHPLKVLTSLQHDLQKWANIIYKSHLIAVEAHLLSAKQNFNNLENTKAFSFETLHSFSHQYLVNAEAFITIAASVGLFSPFSKRYPKFTEGCQISFHDFQKRDYIVRYAAETDLESLYHLEELCWQKQLRSSQKQIRDRLKSYPEGQFVLEMNNKVMGVIFSQRITDIAQIEKCTMDNISTIHNPEGSVIQLLAVNIDPVVQNLNIGDQLLEFMLQRCSLVAGVEKIAAVTICKKFNSNGELSFEQYMRLQGSMQDPILAFHHSHGANIVKSLPGYRPRDKANLGNGVLVEYNIYTRIRHNQREKTVEKKNAPIEQLSRITKQDIVDFLKQSAASLLNINKAEVELDRPVMEMGLNSADLLALQQCITEKFGIELQTGFFFEFSSLIKVAEFLNSNLTEKSSQSNNDKIFDTSVNIPSSKSRKEKTYRNVSDFIAEENDIAIIGISCRLPGGINSPEELWAVLMEEKCVIGEFSKQRGSWPTSIDYPGINQAGFIENAEMFDAGFFRISPTEAQITDPQQRILLELAWECIEDAGILPSKLKGTNTGVFIGASNNDYSRLIQEAKLDLPAHYAIGSSLAVLANRLSYFLDLNGPSLLIDTACSSSLVAVHNALQSLRSGECETALIGGVNFICHPSLSIAYHKAGMLSHDGRCKVFDARANGYVRAEGAVVMLLKPLKDAIRDKDNIHAVIKGSAVNHGGLAAGLTVPNPIKQGDLLTTAWKNAGVSAQDITYIEAHGTGTSLGDPIEIQGILSAYENTKGDDECKHMCGLGSVKSNLGHLEPAAGITGLLKVVLSMKYHKIPASINYEQLNPKITLKNSAFYIQNKQQDWDIDKLRIAGISSFGSGGANAHVVVSEYPINSNSDLREEAYLFVLSAQNAERLRIYAQKVAYWIEAHALNINLGDAIYNWQTGRSPMKFRLAIKTTNWQQLLINLKKWLENGKSTAEVWSGQAASTDQNLERLLQSKIGKKLIDLALFAKDLEQLGILWTSGINIDWNKIYDQNSTEENQHKRISLPTYPFAREKYWFDQSAINNELIDIDSKQDTGIFYATPVWQSGAIPLSFNRNEKAHSHHYVFICEMENNPKQIQALIPNCSCTSLLYKQKTIDHRFMEIAGEIFKEIKSEVVKCSPGKVLFQIVLPNNREHVILAGLSGMLQTATLENPNIASQIIITNPKISDNELADQLLQNTFFLNDSIIKYESGSRQILQWQQIQKSISDSPIPFKENGIYLITGGVGSLGIIFTKEILKQISKATVLLTGRSKLSTQKQNILDQLHLNSWQQVKYKQLDISDLTQVEQFFASIKNEYRNLNGIIHCAGMIKGNFISNKSNEELIQVMMPKVKGSFNIDLASKDFELDFFVLFSSIASVIGDHGLADYAAANGFMDQFAIYRNSQVKEKLRYGRTISINWPLWKDGGMVKDPATQNRLLKTLGMMPLDTSIGVQSFYQSIQMCQSQVLVMKGVISKIAETVTKTNQFEVEKNIAIDHSIALNPQILYEATLQKIKSLVGKVLELPAEKIDAYEALSSYGIDSIFINKLNSEFANVFGTISKTLFFEYQTLADLTSYFIKDYKNKCAIWTGCVVESKNNAEIKNTGDAPNPVIITGQKNYDALDVNSSASCYRNQPIAIIGISGIYPNASNLDEYWLNLKNGRNCIREIPSDRWNMEGFFEPDKCLALEMGKSYSKWGGFIDQFSQFDALFFGISPREAMNIDPQERIFLQEAWRTLENSGYTVSDLKRKFKQRVGVFAGITKTGYDFYGQQYSNGGEKFFPRTSFGSVSNRLSYILDLTSSSLSVDTMCSSSLTAIHEACEHIHRGECDLAFAGGVNLYLHPSSYIWLCAQHMLSVDGLCKSFGAGANGFVPGEGVGVILLRPLYDAIKDNDNIHGIILSTNVNHGGRTNGYFVPNPKAHSDLIARAICKAGISAREISYIEAHGTGTELGDPIEIAGLQQAFSKDTNEVGYCSIGSVKSNIGHLESAAGIAGLTKILLQMKHCQIVPSLHSNVLNSNIDFQNTPFVVNQTLKAWEHPLIDGQVKPRIAGISSFGAGGVNAHVLLQEYVSPLVKKDSAIQIVTKEQVVIVLSAKTKKQLKKKAADLADYIGKSLTQENVDLDIHDVAYTLQIGRDPMEERLGFIVNSVSQLEEKLRAYVNDEQDIENLFYGQVKQNKETIARFSADSEFQKTIDKWIIQNELGKLLELWVKGLELPWQRLYSSIKPQRICLPTYPFADDRYWIDSLEPIKTTISESYSVLHPMLHLNTSDFSQLRYSSTFNGEEIFIAKVSDKQFLPAIHYLEMAYAAIVHSIPCEDEFSVEMRNIRWFKPFILSDRKSVSISLSLQDENKIQFEVYSRTNEEQVIHSQGEANIIQNLHCEKINLQQLQNNLHQYALPIVKQQGQILSDVFGCNPKTIAYKGNDQLLIEISHQNQQYRSQSGFYLHPIVLNKIIFACTTLRNELSGISIPQIKLVGIDSVSIWSKCKEEMYASIHLIDNNVQSKYGYRFDVDLIDKFGTICVKICGLEISTEELILTESSYENDVLEEKWDKISHLCSWESQPLFCRDNQLKSNRILIVCCGNVSQVEETILEYYKCEKKSEILLIRIDEKTAQISENEWLCGVNDEEGFLTCLRKFSDIDTLFFIASAEYGDSDFSSERISRGQEYNEIQLLRLIKLLKHKNVNDYYINSFIITIDAFSINNQPNRYEGAGLTGLGYSLAQGNYQFLVRNIDISMDEIKNGDSRRDLFDLIINEPVSGQGEVIKIYGGKRYRQAFSKIIWENTENKAIKEKGVYIIVGGSGTVGQIMTQNLLQKYNAYVIWIGRSAENSTDLNEKLRMYDKFGGKLSYFQADITNFQSIKTVINRIKKKHNQINGAIFAAMVFDFNNSIEKTTEEEFRTIIDVKTKGCAAFYNALEKEKMDFMCFFSSGQAYAFSGAAKFAGYATGITYSDSFINAVQHNSNFPVGIINWGYWQSTVEAIKTEDGVSTQNFGAIEDLEGFSCFERFVSNLVNRRLHQVMCVKLSSYTKSLMNYKNNQYIIAKSGEKICQDNISLIESSETQELILNTQGYENIQNVVEEDLPVQDINTLIENEIIQSLSATLKIQSNEIDPEIAFSDYGIDSILAAYFIGQVNKRLSLNLNTAIVFEFSSAKRLTQHIQKSHTDKIKKSIGLQLKTNNQMSVHQREHVLKAQAEKQRNTAVQIIRPIHNQWTSKLLQGNCNNKLVEIAVVGISGKFPKSDSIDELWKNLIENVDCIEDIPAKHLNQRFFLGATEKSGNVSCKRGGILEKMDCFDPLFFNISPIEAAAMNPHQRLIIQECWRALEDAGYNPKKLSGTQTGIYVGAESTGYFGESFTGFSDAITASRLSYFANFRGPALAVNTGCSASAVAIHLACESLRNKETDMALAGGVSTCIDQNLRTYLEEIGMLSPSGRCYTFDTRADGTVLSEGVGIVVLKRLEDAIESGDHIFGIICGSGVNQDGASNGITAPNGEAQEELILKVYEKFKINPENITYLEAHGTGTKLGDPVEANALIRAFRKYTSKTNFCAIGSAKANIGHTAAASGVIGLIKVLLSMCHKKIPKLLNYEILNPLIQLNDSPFYINTHPIEWNGLPGLPRMAAINSFGHSGTNAHIVVKEYIPSPKELFVNNYKEEENVIIPLSAKTRDQLKQKAKDLVKFLDNSQSIDIYQLAYTLQVGREGMDIRLAFIVSSIEQLRTKLKSYIDGNQDTDMFYGQVSRGKDDISRIVHDEDILEAIDRWIIRKKYAKLLELWVKGLNFEWDNLYNNTKPKRMRLPTYPFSEERYWIEPSKELNAMTTEVCHPMVHVNVSDIKGLRYASTFTGKESFLRDHKVNGESVLPGVAYLEMVRASVEFAISVSSDSNLIELHNVAWVLPVVVTGAKKINIGLYTNLNDGRLTDEVGFEISSKTNDEEIIHCQGQAVYRPRITQKIEIKKIINQLNHSIHDSKTIYSVLSGMGIEFGPAHRALISVYKGNDQLVAQLKLPSVVDGTINDYVLHPSLMDGALQSCICLLTEGGQYSQNPLLPFALRSLRIISSCTNEMYAWVRYSPHYMSSGEVVKIDIDMCDREGNVCVQFREFTARFMHEEINSADTLFSDKNSIGEDCDAAIEEILYQQLIERVSNKEISVDDAMKLL